MVRMMCIGGNDVSSDLICRAICLICPAWKKNNIAKQKHDIIRNRYLQQGKQQQQQQQAAASSSKQQRNGGTEARPKMLGAKASGKNRIGTAVLLPFLPAPPPSLPPSLPPPQKRKAPYPYLQVTHGVTPKRVRRCSSIHTYALHRKQKNKKTRQKQNKRPGKRNTHRTEIKYSVPKLIPPPRKINRTQLL